MEQNEINAVLAAVADQRNAALNDVAVKHAALVVALADIEGLNKIIAEQKKLAMNDLDKVMKLEAKLEDLRATPICVSELQSRINFLEGCQHEQKKTIQEKNSVISGLEVQLKNLRGDHLPKDPNDPNLTARKTMVVNDVGEFSGPYSVDDERASPDWFDSTKPTPQPDHKDYRL